MTKIPVLVEYDVQRPSLKQFARPGEIAVSLRECDESGARSLKTVTPQRSGHKNTDLDEPYDYEFSPFPLPEAEQGNHR